MAKKIKAAKGSEGRSRGAESRWGKIQPQQRWLLGLGIAAAVAALWFGLSEGPVSQFAPVPPLLSPARLVHPIEVNEWNRPSPVGSSTLRAVDFVDERNGWVVGDGGTIFHTSDGGETWERQQSPTSEELLCVEMLPGGLGWAGGVKGTLLTTKDDGRNWRKAPTGHSQTGITAIHFLNERTGWIGGVREPDPLPPGVILRTTDGGATWQVNEGQGRLSSVSDLAFVDASKGWCATDTGNFTTSDGGRTWTHQKLAPPLSSVSFVDEKRGWAIDTSERIWNTTDGGFSWREQRAEGKLPRSVLGLTVVRFFNADLGWAAGGLRTVLMTRDGGTTWNPVKATEPRTDPFGGFSGAAVTKGGRAWLVGSSGSIGVVDRGGASWRLATSGVSPDFKTDFAEDGGGWALVGGTRIMRTSDYGRVWREKGPRQSIQFAKMAFGAAGPLIGLDERGRAFWTSSNGAEWTSSIGGPKKGANGLVRISKNGALLTTAEAIYRSEDSGRTWKEVYRDPRLFLESVTCSDQGSAWAVSSTGVILGSRDYGATWKEEYSNLNQTFTSVSANSRGDAVAVAGMGDEIMWRGKNSASWEPSGTPGNGLSSVHLTSSGVGWAVGEDGIVLRSLDGFQTWEAVSDGTREDGRNPVSSLPKEMDQIVGFDATRACASSWSAGQFCTSDGGKTWQSAGTYHRYPAPLFYLLLLTSMGLFIAAARPTVLSNREQVSDLANADAPVQSLAEDRLGQGRLVDRLAGFIQNPQTSPPLVMTIQGGWGMGKSSFMAMLRDQLIRNRAAHTVWFNAWHHHSEDQLLAYLLQTIQRESIPPWFSPLGLSFRWNLFFNRLFASPGWLVVVGASLFLLLGGSGVAGFLKGLIPPSLASTLREWLAGVPVLQGLGATILVPAVLKILHAFSSSPEKLAQSSLAAAKSYLNLPTLSGKTDVREEFAKSLKQVVEALKPQRLVIFLDDLDRCKPEQVVQILESVSFISSSAPVFVVLGADYQKVEALAGLHFENVALAEYLAKPGADEQAAKSAVFTAQLRNRFARHYMRKIVNIRINLLAPTDEDKKAFVAQEPPRQPSRWLRLALRVSLMAVFVASLASLNIPWSDLIAPEPGASNSQPAPTKEAAVEKGSVPVAPQSVSPAQGEQSKETDKPTPDSRTEDGGSTRTTIILVSFLILGAGAAILFLVQPRSIEGARDSESFRDAIQKNSSAIWSKCGDSPREVRRFLNNLRLTAAAPEKRPPSRLQKFLDQLPTRRKRLPEPHDPDHDLRQRFSDLDSQLVQIALNPESVTDKALRERHKRSCALLDLNPETFTAREDREGIQS